MGTLSHPVDAVLLALTPGLPLALALLGLMPALRGLVFRLLPLAPIPGLLIAVVPPGRTLDLAWLLLGSRLGVDPATRVFALLSGAVWLVGALYTRQRMIDDVRRTRFATWFLLTMAGNLGMIVAQDFYSLYLCYALMGFAAYGLVVHDGQPASHRAGRVYLYLVVVAELALFTAGILMVQQAETPLLPELAEAFSGNMAMACVAVAFAVKAGALPLHYTLPLIYRRAPPAAGLVLAAAMINAGLLGWWRLLPMGAEQLSGWGTAFLAAGLAAAFFGVAMGLFQRHPRALLAYSSISQMGLMTLTVGIALIAPGQTEAALTAALVYALHHALAKGALFMGIDVVPGLGGAGRRWAFAALLLPALALGGLPLTSGAAAKLTLTDAAEALPPPWPTLLHVLLPLAALGTTWLTLRFVGLLWRRHSTETPGAWTTGLWLLLVAGSALLIWLHPVNPVSPLATLSPDKLWTGLWPVAAGAVAAWALLRHEARTARPFQLPAGDIAYWTARGWRRLRPRYRGLRLPVERLYRWPERAGQWTAQRLGPRLLKGEARMTRWTAAGTAVLTVMALVTAILALV